MEMQHLHAAERKDPLMDVAFCIFTARRQQGGDDADGKKAMKCVGALLCCGASMTR
jgi:hypothetical protein